MWYEIKKEGVLLRIQVQPKASRTEVAGLHGDRLKIRVAAPPVEGEANDELVRFLKKALGVTNKDIELVRGQNSKLKDVFCRGISGEQALGLIAGK